MRLEIWLGERLVGWLGTDAESRFTFIYSPEWLRWNERFPLSPQLPLTDAAPSPERHSAIVRHFFDNLLPEGRALDEASQAYQVSRSNMAALLAALGRETAGAFRIQLEQTVVAGEIADDGHEQRDHNPRDPGDRSQPARELSFEELSQRIRARPYTPFSVWDGRVRLSIAGLQDKLAVTEREGRWYLPDGRASSTLILKPDIAGHAHAGLTSNELFCMRLARRAGLPAATVRLAHVPEPVLVVERFDRRVDATGGITRVHIIDGCQALGLPPSHKYEHQFGSGRDVAHLRDGASLPRLFHLLRPAQVAAPAVERQRLLRWALFQVLIGNTDAHAKNLSFFSSAAGLSIAPAYDLVSVSALPINGMDNNYAMAIGDAFRDEDLNAEEWVDMALACGLPPRLVATELMALTARVVAALPEAISEALREGALPDVVERVRSFIAKQCEGLAAMSRGIRRRPPGKGV